MMLVAMLVLVAAMLVAMTLMVRTIVRMMPDMRDFRGHNHSAGRASG